jgi:5-methyltetrahydropteroyltriglutamate--homocysteine methyltransferase
MDWIPHHLQKPDVSFDGGSLDCGNGLLLLIRQHIDPLESGQHLEILSRDSSVEEDLPAWCKLTSNELVSRSRVGDVRSYLVRKGESARRLPKTVVKTDESTEQVSIPTLPPFAVMGIGSWPRPGWLLRMLHDRLSGKLAEDEFQQYADDAVRLAANAQERAGADVLTDGEQRRDNYASFVGSRLENCQLIPITDLLPYVTDPDEFAQELKALDVPATEVRHPAVFGKIARKQPLALHEFQRLRRLTKQPIKVALPGPYLLTRTMWLECVADKAYPNREELAEDIVRVLREEIRDLMQAGAAIVQLDEPVLTEVVFTRKTAGRSFMCGALGAKRDTPDELDFARELIQKVLHGFPKERLAIHVCRGNWSRDESVALTGPYTPLVGLLKSLPVGTYFLEMATPRAGELEPLLDLPEDAFLGLGVVNQKLDAVETTDEILRKVEPAVKLFGSKRLRLNPDCGFATFADNPLASAEVAEQKLRAIVQAARLLRER